MRITVYLGEPLWRAVGRREVELPVADGATVGDALAALAHLYPTLSADLGNDEMQPAVFVNDAAASAETLLTPEARLTIVWPVSGGCQRIWGTD